MKHHNLNRFALALALTVFTAGVLQAAPDTQVRQPTLDAEGRFWVYRNGPLHPKMPFSPYGWMSDITNLSQIIRVDLDCRDHPNAVIKPPTPEREFCIRVKLTWADATWASIAFISGPDKPAWWGDTDGGRYYDLSALPKKKLIFYARGAKGDEVIKAQIGALGDKPFGDSAAKPIVSESLKLTQDWTRYEIDLKDAPAADLAKICNGFGVVAERAVQPATVTETVFYLDDIYFE